MMQACPVPDPDAPLVRSLLSLTDCHVREFTRLGYASLFPTGGALTPALTAMLTAFVAVTGVQLMLGRGALRVGDLTLTVLKLVGIIVFATQWETYQFLVFRVLFDGPAQLAGAMTRDLGGVSLNGDVFDALQRAFDVLSAAASPSATATGSTGGVATAGLATGAVTPSIATGGMTALALSGAAGLLLVSGLGVLLAAKVVLGLLLATGPIFIGLLIFETTRGLFEGWLRMALGFAFVPLAITVLLAMMLSILAPWLAGLDPRRALTAGSSGSVYGVVTVVIVFALVSAAVLFASVSVFAGFRPTRRLAEANPGAATRPRPSAEVLAPSRAEHLASVAGAQARREALRFEASHRSGEPGGQRTAAATFTGSGAAAAAARGSTPNSSRPGEGGRRTISPRATDRREHRRLS